MDGIYSIFNEKLPVEMECLTPRKGLLVTFLNPYSLYKASDKLNIYRQFTFIGSDGIFPLFLNRVFGRKKSTRLSFDMSSVAKFVFNYATLHNLSIYFIGATQEQVNKFVLNVKEVFPGLNIIGWRDGYIGSAKEQGIELIKNLEPDIVVVGMGTPLQDEFAIELANSNYCGAIYTCGGFIHQASEKLNYFNGWINRLHVRFLYRMIKEPYVFKRVFCYYPKFFVSYIGFLFRYKS